ncbi:hypothetical protein [Enterobacter hormaechei]|uniref:hypothetical protein n=1 Tax=Enterobacter hormaechei TaxID=158836 RepID=UPI0008FFF4F9|nr:hypothetical protein [Enterobacter hormaechei]
MYKNDHQLRLVVILVVLTKRKFRISLIISQLLAKAIPVRGAKFKKPAFRAGFLLFCVREIIGWRLHLTRPT